MDHTFESFQAKGHPRVSERAKKRILILSDSKLLSNVIEANLKQAHLEVGRFELHGGNPVSPKNQVFKKGGHPDLILVASISAASEPIIALFRAALTEKIGQTPILIISDRQFQADPEGQIYHLDFPFAPDALRDRIQTLLALANTNSEHGPDETPDARAE